MHPLLSFKLSHQKMSRLLILFLAFQIHHGMMMLIMGAAQAATLLPTWAELLIIALTSLILWLYHLPKPNIMMAVFHLWQLVIYECYQHNLKELKIQIWSLLSYCLTPKVQLRWVRVTRTPNILVTLSVVITMLGKVYLRIDFLWIGSLLLYNLPILAQRTIQGQDIKPCWSYSM